MVRLIRSINLKHNSEQTVELLVLSLYKDFRGGQENYIEYTPLDVVSDRWPRNVGNTLPPIALEP